MGAPALSKLILSLASLVALLGGCASSGSSSGSMAPAPVTKISTVSLQTSTTLQSSAPTAAEIVSRHDQSWLNQINKPSANQLGTGDGTGVVIASVDTGIKLDHPMLAGQVVATYNSITDLTDVTDLNGHGTAVASIAAGTMAGGAKYEGVAHGAKLAIAQASSGSTGSMTSLTVGAGIDWAVNIQKAPILSLSLGNVGSSMLSNMQNAVIKGTLLTAALGNNEGSTTAALYPASFAKEVWANGQIIAVGAVDSSNKRASFSNYDPTLADWTVYAPGVNVLTGVRTSEVYGLFTGTSAATPMVAGQAAIIKSNWNFLSAKNIAQIIFKSATRLCSDAVSASVCAARTTSDAEFGWGLINIGASLQPIGSLNVLTQSGQSVLYAGTLLATPKSGLATGLTDVITVAVDSFNRGFITNIPAVALAAVTVQSTPSTPVAVTTSGASKFTYEFSSESGVTNSAAINRSSQSFNENGLSYGVGVGGTSNHFFGLDSTGTTPLNRTGQGSRFNTPYFDLAGNATHVGYGFAIGDGATLRFGSVIQGRASSASFGSAAASVGTKTLTTVELQKNFGSAVAVITAGTMREQDTLMGLSATGAMALKGASQTQFVTFAGSKTLGSGISLSSMLSLGNTSAFNNSAVSLIDGTTASRSMAWSLGLAKIDAFHNGDRFGLTVSMPLRTMSGQMNVTTAVRQSQTDGALQYATRSIGLAPTGSEKDIEMSYALPLLNKASFSAVAQIKMQPGHDARAETMHGVGVKYQKPF